MPVNPSTFICNLCIDPKTNKPISFDKLQAYLTHSSRRHKRSSEEVYCNFLRIKKTPLCKCGCGKKLDFQTFALGYGNYKNGHGSDTTR